MKSVATKAATTITRPATKTGCSASARACRIAIAIAGGRCASWDGSKTAVAVAELPDDSSFFNAAGGRYLAIADAIPWDRIVPRMARPIAEPMDRDSCVVDVATAMSRALTAF